MGDPNVYGYVNGKAVYSRDEFIFTSRGFEEIISDAELLKFAEKVTYGWQDSGHKQSFAGFYLSDYALSEPYRSLTKKEFARLKELQKQAREEVEREQAKYNFSNFEGRPLTEEEIEMFLNKAITDAEKKVNGDFYGGLAREAKSEKMARWRKGEVIEVASYEYSDKYGNGTGDFAKVLMSDGTIQNICYGYSD
jgi:hypothetical protein